LSIIACTDLPLSSVSTVSQNFWNSPSDRYRQSRPSTQDCNRASLVAFVGLDDDSCPPPKEKFESENSNSVSSAVAAPPPASSSLVTVPAITDFALVPPSPVVMSVYHHQNRCYQYHHYHPRSDPETRLEF